MLLNVTTFTTLGKGALLPIKEVDVGDGFRSDISQNLLYNVTWQRSTKLEEKNYGN